MFRSMQWALCLGMALVVGGCGGSVDEKRAKTTEFSPEDKSNQEDAMKKQNEMMKKYNKKRR